MIDCICLLSSSLIYAPTNYLETFNCHRKMYCQAFLYFIIIYIFIKVLALSKLKKRLRKGNCFFLCNFGCDVKEMRYIFVYSVKTHW